MQQQGMAEDDDDTPRGRAAGGAGSDSRSGLLTYCQYYSTGPVVLVKLVDNLSRSRVEPHLYGITYLECPMSMKIFRAWSTNRSDKWRRFGSDVVS